MRLESARSERRYRPPRKGSNWSFHHHHELLCNFEKQIKRFLSIISGQQPCKRKMFFRLKKFQGEFQSFENKMNTIVTIAQGFLATFFLLLIKQTKKLSAEHTTKFLPMFTSPLKTSSSENT